MIRLFKAVIKCGILDSNSLSIQVVKPGYDDMTHIDSVVVFLMTGNLWDIFTNFVVFIKVNLY